VGTAELHREWNQTTRANFRTEKRRKGRGMKLILLQKPVGLSFARLFSFRLQCYEILIRKRGKRPESLCSVQASLGFQTGIKFQTAAYIISSKQTDEIQSALHAPP
jgi:hypothetical protein